MASLSKLKINGAEVQAYLDGANGVSALLDSRAEEVLGRAQASAPVDTGAYRASLHIETDHTDRMVKRVVAGTDHAWVVEAKTGNLAKAI